MTVDDDRVHRTGILRDLGATTAGVAELLPYAESGFDPAALAAAGEYPLADEPFVSAWQRVEHEAATVGTSAALRQMLVQLQFPVAEGMSTNQDYLAATRRGVFPGTGADAGATFNEPDRVSVRLHPTAAGRLPVIVADARADFEMLVCALSKRNEPQPIPPSMGACIVGGYNNWTRMAAIRSEWAASNPGSAQDESAWSAEFARIVPQRARYQDRFIVLSTGPYSDTPAHVLGLSHNEWRRLSLTIRLEHECAHYFTRRVFGSMRNALLDELIADYSGIVAAVGRFEPEWFLRFMGVENAGFRPGGRLTNYRGTPPLSDSAFAVLQEVVRRAARTLDEFDVMVRGASEQPSDARTLTEVAAAITAIARLGLERLTEHSAAQALYADYAARIANASEFAFRS